ncbi:MAG: tetratricopeptide repeat protein [Planctomycetaceae bacterium]
MNESTSPEQTAGRSAKSSTKRVGVPTRILRVCVALGIAAALVWGAFWVYEQFRPSQQIFQLGQRAIMLEDYPAADKYARRLIRRDPDSKQGFLLKGLLASRRNRPEEALEWFRKVPDDRSPEAGDARSNGGIVLMYDLHQPSQALSEAQRGYDQNPFNPSANNLIPDILRLGTRTWELVPYEVWIAKFGMPYGYVSPRRLYDLSLGHSLHTNVELLQKCAEAAPDDPIVRLGLADVAMNEKRYDEAEEHYRHVIASHPEILEAKVRLGQALAGGNSAAKFYQWNAGLPKEADAHPLTWAIRGKWADEHGEPKVAIRCFWEAVRLDPNHLPAVDRLGQLLTAEKRTDDAKKFLDRARLLNLYMQATQELNVLTEKPDILKPWAAANRASELGLMSEAYAWVGLTQQLDPEQQQVLDAAKQIQKLLEKAPPTRALPAVNPAAEVDLSKYPRPNWPADAPAEVKPAAASEPSQK